VWVGRLVVVAGGGSSRWRLRPAPVVDTLGSRGVPSAVRGIDPGGGIGTAVGGGSSGGDSAAGKDGAAEGEAAPGRGGRNGGGRQQR